MKLMSERGFKDRYSSRVTLKLWKVTGRQRRIAFYLAAPLKDSAGIIPDSSRRNRHAGRRYGRFALSAPNSASHRTGCSCTGVTRLVLRALLSRVLSLTTPTCKCSVIFSGWPASVASINPAPPPVNSTSSTPHAPTDSAPAAPFAAGCDGAHGIQSISFCIERRYGQRHRTAPSACSGGCQLVAAYGQCFWRCRSASS